MSLYSTLPAGMPSAAAALTAASASFVPLVAAGGPRAGGCVPTEIGRERPAPAGPGVRRRGGAGRGAGPGGGGGVGGLHGARLGGPEGGRGAVLRGGGAAGVAGVLVEAHAAAGVGGRVGGRVDAPPVGGDGQVVPVVGDVL